MKRDVICSFLCAGILGASVGSAAAAEKNTSDWDTNFAKMHLSQDGSRLEGTYEYSGGKVTATLQGRVLKGWWSETDDKLMCGPDGKWSGPMVFRLAADGKSFSGNYGKCERGESSHDNLPADRTWTGKLLSGVLQLSSNSEWDTNFSKMRLAQDGSKLEGTYDHAGGKLTATLEGRVLKGWWSETDDKLMCGPEGKWSGPMVLRFSADGKSFSGEYGKCERGESTHENLPADREWTGKNTSGALDFP